MKDSQGLQDVCGNESSPVLRENLQCPTMILKEQMIFVWCRVQLIKKTGNTFVCVRTYRGTHWTNSTKRARETFLCISLGWSERGLLTRDHLDHGASKESKNPFPEWIYRFLWCTVIEVILDQYFLRARKFLVMEFQHRLEEFDQFVFRDYFVAGKLKQSRILRN